MKNLAIALPAALLLNAGTPETDYAAERTLRLVAETTIAMETTEFSMTRDGEPVEARGGSGASQEQRTIVQTFRVLEHEDGAPVRVRRSFEKVTSKTERERRDGTTESELECPLDGVTLEISLEDDEVVVEVVDGGEPDDDAVLEGHGLTLSLDALLPEGDVAEGDSWELEGEAVLRALDLDLDAAFFPVPAPTEPAEGERRGRRGGGRSSARLLVEAEWSAEATLKATDTEHEGLECLEIALELDGEGELAPRQLRFGGRRGRVLEPGDGALATDNDYSIEIEGRLLFSAAEGRPVLLDLEGSISTSRYSEFDRGESSMTMRTAEEGSFEHRVEVTAE